VSQNHGSRSRGDDLFVDLGNHRHRSKIQVTPPINGRAPDDRYAQAKVCDRARLGDRHACFKSAACDLQSRKARVDSRPQRRQRQILAVRREISAKDEPEFTLDSQKPGRDGEARAALKHGI
jgi:hypothetical protein